MSEYRPWANPAPAGLVALALAVMLFYAMLQGLIDSSSNVYIGFWLLGGFIVQGVCGLIDLKEGALTGGNVFLFFAGFFMFAGGCIDILSYYANLYGWQMNALANGYAWIILSAALITWTPAYLKEAPKVFSSLVLILDVFVVCVTLIKLEMASPAIISIASVMAFLAVFVAMYFAMAVIINGAWGRAVLPVGTPWIK
jgi:hypothetical protein